MCATDWAQVDIVQIKSKLNLCKTRRIRSVELNSGKFLTRLTQFSQVQYMFALSKIQQRCFVCCEDPTGHTLITRLFATCMPNFALTHALNNSPLFNAYLRVPLRVRRELSREFGSILENQEIPNRAPLRRQACLDDDRRPIVLRRVCDLGGAANRIRAPRSWQCPGHHRCRRSQDRNDRIGDVTREVT